VPTEAYELYAADDILMVDQGCLYKLTHSRDASNLIAFLSSVLSDLNHILKGCISGLEFPFMIQRESIKAEIT
jgi:hypothetical protein